VLLKVEMEVAAPFNLFVTHVGKEYGLVKIFGQTDVPTGSKQQGQSVSFPHLFGSCLRLRLGDCAGLVQCCGSEIVCYGSGSDLSKSLIRIRKLPCTLLSKSFVAGTNPKYLLLTRTNNF
jgi:hypothetical protein